MLGIEACGASLRLGPPLVGFCLYRGCPDSGIGGHSTQTGGSRVLSFQIVGPVLDLIKFTSAGKGWF